MDEQGDTGSTAANPRVIIAEAVLKRIFTSQIYSHLIYGSVALVDKGRASGDVKVSQRNEILSHTP